MNELDPYAILFAVALPLASLWAIKGKDMLKVLSTGASESKKFSLDGTDLWKLFVNALIVGGGAFLTAMEQSISEFDFGEWTVAIVAANTVLVNFARKFFADNKP